MGDTEIVHIKMRREGKGIVAKEKIEHKNGRLRDYKVNRENNTYDEVVIDESGSKIYENHEQLSKHRGHGSDKKKFENKNSTK